MEDPHHPARQNAQAAEGEAARHALRFERQAAIRAGRYLPPLPQFPQYLLEPPQNPNLMEVFDRAMEVHIHHRAQLLLARLRPVNFEPGNGIVVPEDNDYQPLSPQRSDDEAELDEQALERHQNLRRNFRRYMRPRGNAIPHEVFDRLMHEYQRLANQREHNNNGQFRDFNGILSPAPSPSPPLAVSPAPSEDDAPMEQGRDADVDIEMLNVQLMEMQPNQPRQRKRQNSVDAVPIKKKRVTFKDNSSDEDVNYYNDDTEDCTGTSEVNRKPFDDDDEGFFGGPSAQQNNIPCA
ncbi:hypothetical protein GCK72_024988 [Caenorhabditis remanei]|uniref:Uncharacterized protein n=1 Tax=Caenorhabditis remanei TaxID=31234 RepID=E3MRN7_CAERE|nr:hypothetical protein GCK72_024988 [Caenorhabditis remanei]EFP08020.1 hypothetical protein CRE_14781 [Caenorhabditis remanei]KAF1748521.1 hypothetical protein GCK72_024988 [Caenorhabditis remanei]